MGIVGPFVAYGLYRGLPAIGFGIPAAIFAAATFGDLSTYVVTSFQLALAFPDPVGGVVGAAVKFLGIFAVTQVPLAISEGLLSVIVWNLLAKYSKEELNSLGAFQGRAA
jgi:cobalt/nickel transport system permease protein